MQQKKGEEEEVDRQLVIVHYKAMLMWQATHLLLASWLLFLVLVPTGLLVNLLLLLRAGLFHHKVKEDIFFGLTKHYIRNMGKKPSKN